MLYSVTAEQLTDFIANNDLEEGTRIFVDKNAIGEFVGSRAGTVGSQAYFFPLLSNDAYSKLGLIGSCARPTSQHKAYVFTDTFLEKAQFKDRKMGHVFSMLIDTEQKLNFDSVKNPQLEKLLRTYQVPAF